MDYTKYVLKSKEELAAMLAGKDNFFVVACNKCFKAFDTTDEPDCGCFTEIAQAQGKHLTGSVKVDFLCNKVQTEKKLAGIVPEGTENVVVISCGLGVQTVADLETVPTFTATNSLNYIGHHGMALTKKTCGACAQCYLNATGGICPIVDCTKSLVNGQCGGAKNGKCEIDPKKDCAWEKIYQRLEKQGRTEEFLNQPVQLRDYSVAGVEEIKAYVAEARAKRYEGFYGGVHPTEHKDYTEHLALQKFPEPDTVIIPLAMHIGAPANPIVNPGDHVNVGQLIGEQAGFIGAPIHASVSGTVVAVEPHTHPNKGPGVMSVVIKNDGKNTLDPSVVPNKPLEELTADEIIEIVKEKGIVGMGGATFPTYVKLKPGKPIDAVLINGSECEPYLTADHRIMLEYADDIVCVLEHDAVVGGQIRLALRAVDENGVDGLAGLQLDIGGEGCAAHADDALFLDDLNDLVCGELLERLVGNDGRIERVFAIIFDDDAHDAGALVRMRMRLDGDNRAADARVNGSADEARLLADELADVHMIAGVDDGVGRCADVHRQGNDDGVGLRELLERQMLGVVLVLGGMNAAVEAFIAFCARFCDVSLDLLHAGDGIVAQLDGLVEEFFCPPLFFQALIDLLPRTVLFGIDLALAVLCTAALAVDKALRAVHDGTDAAGRVEVALGARTAGLLRQRHAMVADVVQGIGRGKRGDGFQVGDCLHAEAAGNDHNVLGPFGNDAGQLLFGLDLVAQEVYLDRSGEVLALRLRDLGKAAAIRLVGGVERFEALVARNDKEVILPGQHGCKLFLAL